jgi:hypothetical protein
MAKRSWSKGARERTHLVRIDADVYEDAKKAADKALMPLKRWVSQLIRERIWQGKNDAA